MTESEFDELAKTHTCVATGWSSETMSSVTVLGNDKGTPIAMRFMSSETDSEFQFVTFDRLTT